MLDERREIQQPATSFSGEGTGDEKTDDTPVASESSLRSEFVALQSALKESAARNDPSLLLSSIEKVQHFIDSPHASQIVEELLEEKLQLQAKASHLEEQMPSSTTTEQQQSPDQEEAHQENRGGMKIADVVSSLELYKMALEKGRVNGRSATEKSSLDNKPDATAEITSQDFQEEGEKHALMQKALETLREDPMLAALVCLIGEEPEVLGFFVHTLNAIKETKEKVAEEKDQSSGAKMEPMIDIAELIMLILTCDLIS